MHHHHSGFGYSNYTPSFGTDMNRDGLITESDFAATARSRGWGYEGKLF